MTKNLNKKKPYYEFPFADNNTRLEIVFAVLVMIWLTLPLILSCVVFVILADRLDTPVQKIMLIVACFALNFFWYWRIFWIADHKAKPLIKFPNARYYLNDPEGYKKVTIEPMTDGKTMNRLYHDGGVFFNQDPDESKLNYIYNLLKDKGILTGDSLKIYVITKEDFLNNFTFYEPLSNRWEKLYVISYADLDLDRETFEQVRKSGSDPWYYWCSFSDFKDFVEGYVSGHGGASYRYKEQAAQIPKD